MERGKAWAYSSFGLGILTSMAGNVGHTLLRPHAPLGAILFSLFWPAAVFLSIETMASVTWPKGTVWSVARFGGLSLVAMVALVASYHHISALLASYGESELVVKIGPLSPDGLMIVATVALLANRRPEPAQELQTDAPEGDGVAPAPRALTGALRAARQRRQVATRDAQAERKAQAVERYRQSMADGQPLSGDDLGKMFGMSGRWGRDRIAEARQELDGQPQPA